VYIASHQRDVSGRRIHLHAWHVPAFNGLIRALEHQALAWCTPNNPTGLLPERQLLQAIADRCKSLNINLILDEAFIDFIPH
ncbi:aminotransferase class I/II-fold pyridoxal phosphate-dependent enzyme, partial [Salmonella enterica subsp. enterica serovar Muenster]|nr:aminotransferase class I/II-fold pyridoxal phosphate-dependent enzyme [Salmonella enterica subsp. enterica serovar Muenster]